MAEYINIKDVEELIEDAIEDSWELDYTLERLKEINPANVIERSEYEKIQKQVKALQNRCKALTEEIMCEFCPLECELRTAQFRGD